MDNNSSSKYNEINKSFGVIDMSTISTRPKVQMLSEVEQKQKPQSISELRKMLAIKTAPGHSLVQLYKRGQ